MNVRSSVYTAIESRLLETLPLQWVAMERGQVDNAQDDYPMPLPAALIEIGRIDWHSMVGMQVGDTIVTVRLWLEQTGDSYDGSETASEDLAVMDMVDQLWEALEGYSTDAFCELTRTNDQIEKRKKNRVCIRMDFATQVAVRSSNMETQVVLLNIDRDGEEN